MTASQIVGALILLGVAGFGASWLARESGWPAVVAAVVAALVVSALVSVGVVLLVGVPL